MALKAVVKTTRNRIRSHTATTNERRAWVMLLCGGRHLPVYWGSQKIAWASTAIHGALNARGELIGKPPQMAHTYHLQLLSFSAIPTPFERCRKGSHSLGVCTGKTYCSKLAGPPHLAVAAYMAVYRLFRW